jgi:hypothetical protein
MSDAKLADLEQRIAQLERENEDLKLAHAKLQNHAGDLLALLRNTSAPIYFKDTSFKYIMVNEFYAQLAHAPRDTIAGTTDYDLFPKAIADLFRQQDEEVIRRGAPCEFEETIQLPDGEFSFITIKYPVLNAEGELRGVGGFCADITARKKFEIERESLIQQLQRAMTEVAALQKIIPICSYCKQIRDDRGYWSQLEAYLAEHADLEFTHGICPSCAEKHFGKVVGAEPQT